MASNYKVRDLTPVEQRYVRMFHNRLTVIEMSRKLRCRKGSVFRFMDQQHLQVLRKHRGGRSRTISYDTTLFNPDDRDWFI